MPGSSVTNEVETRGSLESRSLRPSLATYTDVVITNRKPFSIYIVLRLRIPKLPAFYVCYNYVVV
jgi:hypothetical protein